MKKILIIAAASAALAGCAMPSVQPPTTSATDQTEVYSVEFDRVWENTVDWFALNNIPIKNIEKDSGIIGSEYSLGANYSQIDCGEVNPGSMYTLRDQTVVANVNVLVRRSGNGTSVQPNVFGDGSFTLVDLWNGTPTTFKVDRCVSTGELENSLHQHLRSRL